jgi:hypothetical protein
MAAMASDATPSAAPPTSENPSSATEAGQPGIPPQTNMGIGTTTNEDEHIPLYARWYQKETTTWNVYNALSFEPQPIDELLFNKSEEAILDDYGGRDIQQGIMSPGFLFEWLSPVTQHAIHDQYGIFFLTTKTKTFELWDATDYTISFPPTIGEVPDTTIRHIIDINHPLGDTFHDFPLVDPPPPKLTICQQRKVEVQNRDVEWLFGCHMNEALVDFYSVWRQRSIPVGEENVKTLLFGLNISELYLWYQQPDNERFQQPENQSHQYELEDGYRILKLIWEIAHPASYRRHLQAMGELDKKKRKKHPNHLPKRLKSRRTGVSIYSKCL